MAEQVTDQHTPAKEVNNSQQESPNMDHVPESDKNKLKGAGDTRNEKQKHAGEPKNDNAEDKNQPDVQQAETDHREDKKEDENGPLSPVPTEQQIGKERSEDNQEKESNFVEEISNMNNTDPNTEAENNNGEEEEQAVVKKAEPVNDGDEKEDENLASLSSSPNGEPETDHGEDKKEDESDGSGLYIQENETSSQTETAQISDDVETVGPTTQETVEPPVPVDTRSPGGIIGYLSVVMVIAAILGAAAINHFYQPESPPQIENWRPTVQFLKEMDKLKTKFPNQRAELWNRSRIHLLRHLQTAHPTEPVSLILTAGVRAEKTLHCLARGFASAFSSAFNASVLDIDGASKASQDSDEVKLDIDSKLQGAFEGNTPVAIIHRFEELPPGSTLIFYRYCDHENAAYKKTFLIFTVLLGEEKEIPAESHLSAVEEMVDDHLQNKFLSHGHPVSFDRMDLDKYGGLWSRISHLILPVTTEERMGHEGCEYNRT